MSFHWNGGQSVRYCVRDSRMKVLGDNKGT